MAEGREEEKEEKKEKWNRSITFVLFFFFVVLIRFDEKNPSQKIRFMSLYQLSYTAPAEKMTQVIILSFTKIIPDEDVIIEK
jgi:hypothetical protein